MYAEVTMVALAPKEMQNKHKLEISDCRPIPTSNEIEDRFFPGFPTWGCNRMIGVQAKLGPIGVCGLGVLQVCWGFNLSPTGSLAKSLIEEFAVERYIKHRLL
jgi:hypothetical protein